MKFIFSLVSLLLMIPLLVEGDSGYYRTLFIFLIDRVIDMFYHKEMGILGFRVWTFINQWLGVIACAVAFCSLAPDFAVLFDVHSDIINIVLFVSAVSCVLNEMISLIVISAKEHFAKEKIKNEMKGASV